MYFTANNSTKMHSLILEITIIFITKVCTVMTCGAFTTSPTPLPPPSSLLPPPPHRTQRLHIHISWQSAVTPIVSGEHSHHRDRAPMASRVSFTQLRLEAELERCRAECQWDKMPTIIDQMKAARFHEDGQWLEEKKNYIWGLSPGASMIVFICLIFKPLTHVHKAK